MNYLQLDLMPIDFKKLMRTIKNVSIYTGIGSISLLVFMGFSGFFRDLQTGIMVSLLFLLIIIPCLVPGFRFDKVSQSVINFADDQISVLDKKGSCWRIIDYRSITEIRVEEISGFFYGHNKEKFRNKYVCIFLNGSTAIPNVSFANLFSEKDFLMFGYNTEALNWIRRKTGDGLREP